MKIFLIGPGGVGKSTSGKILAKNLKYEFVDLDLEFMNRIGNIGSFIESFGYEKYAYRNSELFYELLDKRNEDIVFILSSGFLVHKGLEKLVSEHIKTLKTSGMSVLLLPSRDISETVGIVVKRQINRGFGLEENEERKKIEERYVAYLKHGDIKIFSQDKPEVIAEKMTNRLIKCLNL